MKKRRRVKKRAVVSNNALTNRKQKKRFGKKQKKKLLIISMVILLIATVIYYYINQWQQKRMEIEEANKQGKITTTHAEKTKLDEYGEEIQDYIDTEIYVFDVGDAGGTLIKKDRFEVLVDAGADQISDKLKKHIDGSLDCLILTANLPENVSGLNDVYDNFQVDKTIYTESVESLVPKAVTKEKANNQIIDMGQDLSVNISNGVGGSSEGDKSLIIEVNDNGTGNISKILIVGKASAKNILAKASNIQGTLNAYILTGQPLTTNHPYTTISKLAPENIICSSEKKPSKDFEELFKEGSSLNIYSTAEYGTIKIIMNNEGNELKTAKDPNEEEVIQ